MLKETTDKIYFTNSYGQTVSIRKEMLKAFSLNKRLIEHVLPEVAETTDRLFRRQVHSTYRTTSPMEIGLELGVNIGTVGKAMEQLEKMGILERQPTKSLQVGSDIISEPIGDNCIYNILKQCKPKAELF